MKQLFLTIGWLEFVRNKSRTWLLLIIVVAFSFSLSTCGRMESEIQMHAESSSHSQSWHLPDSTTEFDSDYKLSTAFPSFAITTISLVLGFMVLMTVPFRGKQEWEDGQFQMIAMGDYSFYKVEFLRFASYLCLAALFFITVLICAGIFVLKHNLYPIMTVFKLQCLAMYRFTAFAPLFLAFGVLVSAINTAYYRDGKSRVLTLVKYISCLSFFILVFKTANWFEDPSHLLLPVVHVPVDIPGGFREMFILNWEFPLLSLLLAGLFIFWAGRILEEVEA